MLLTLFLAALIGCDTAENPTGECDKGEGGRPCYHSPEPSDTYLPICDGSVDRELWRVFATADGPAYLIPRPDAMGLTLGICDGDDAELAALFERTGLCAEVADPAVINALTVDDALAVSTALHARLSFTVEDYGDGMAGIVPWPPDDELAAVCEAYPDELADISETCDIFAPAADGECLDVGYTLSLEAAGLLAQQLNVLFAQGR